MTPSAIVSHARALALAPAAVIVALLAAAPVADAYTRPPGGSWRVHHLFDSTRSGSLSLSRDGSRVARLVLVPGERSADGCGSAPVRLVSRPTVRSYRDVSGRYAVAVKPRRLFEPAPMVFRRGGRNVRGRLLLLWGRDGRLMETGEVHLPAGCTLGFVARKGR